MNTPTMTAEREAMIAALPRALMDAARRDALTDADRFAIGQAIVVVQDAQRAALAAPPVEQQAAQAEVAKGVLTQLLNARGRKDVLHAQYMGKAMPDEVYDVFHRLRDETIPSLTLQLHEMLAATPPAPTEQPAALFGDEDHVLVPRGLLGSACSVIDKKRDGTKTLAELRRYTVGDLSAVHPTERASQAGALKDHQIALLVGNLATIARTHHGTEQLRQRINAMSGPLPAPVARPTEQPSQDAQALDWLETMTVNVRTPLRYGSHDLFWATPEERDGEAPGPSDIRTKIDAARAGQGQGGAA